MSQYTLVERMEKDTRLSTEKEDQPGALRMPFWAAVVLLLALTLGMFADVLFTSEPLVLSTQRNDIAKTMVHLRRFGFGELRRGNLPLWNPHIFCGIPSLSCFEAALLYPPNLLFYLNLPVHRAINWDIAFHVFLAGMFMYLWTAHRRLHPLACLFSAGLFMFCSSSFLLIFGGHTCRLAVMAWTPLLFLSIDGMFEERSLRWCLVGILAAAMQVLAGAPQFIFNNAVAAAIYSLFCLVRCQHRARMALGLLAMSAGAFGLTAVQMIPGLLFGPESIRAGGVLYKFAASFSFPPENFLTLLTPKFFGDIVNCKYWGRWYMWETVLFVGVTGLILAAYGAARGERGTRRFSLAMVAILLLLALGVHTPLHRILYNWVPGFNMFRGPSKFRVQAVLFIAMLAGIGLDCLIRRPGVRRRMVFATLIIGILVGTAGVALGTAARSGPTGVWSRVMHAVRDTGDFYRPTSLYEDARFIQEAGLFASRSLMISAATWLLLSYLLHAFKFPKRMVLAVAFLGVAEVFIFARATRPTFPLAESRVPEIERLCGELTGDHRFLFDATPNSAMTFGVSNLQAYDVPFGRYAEFISFTQGENPDEADQYLTFSPAFTPRLYEMLRCRYHFVVMEDRMYVLEAPDAMDRLHLIGDWRVLAERDQIFAAMRDPFFDPRRTVILETEPKPRPLKTKPEGEARVVDSSTDHLTIEANLRDPAILLITDPYSKGWRARALPDSEQTEYEVMPANYILRAIPLAAGRHHFRVEYVPPGFGPGLWISATSLVLYAVILTWYWQRRHHARNAPPEL